MLTIFLIIAIPLAIVAAGYYWRDRLSGMRVILLNGVSATVIVAADLVGALIGVPWDQLIGTKGAATMTLILNLATVGLRFLSKTDKPLV